MKTRPNDVRKISSFSYICPKLTTQQSHVCDFLLMINTNWHPISYRFEVVAYYCWNLDTAFWALFGGGSNVYCSY